MKKGQRETDLQTGAENETRTRDPDLGKVVLYQLSYFRDWDCKGRCKVVLYQLSYFRDWDCKGRYYFWISKFFEYNFIFQKAADPP